MRMLLYIVFGVDSLSSSPDLQEGYEILKSPFHVKYPFFSQGSLSVVLLMVANGGTVIRVGKGRNWIY